MKCEKCNLKCNKNVIYCPKSGRLLNYYNNMSLNKLENEICERCNTEQISTNIYCKSCGNLLHKISSDKDKHNNNKFDFINKPYLKEKFLIAISSILLLSIISLFIQLFIFIVDKSMLNYFSTANIILGLNLVPIEVIYSNFMELNKFNLNLGIVIYLIVPIICLSIVINLFKRKSKDVDNVNVIKDSVVIGLIYGIVLGLISIFSSKVLSNNLDIFYSTSITIKYEFSGVVINGTIIGTIISYINLIKYSKNKFTKIGIKSIKTISIVYFLILITLIASTYVGNVLGYSKNLISIVSLIQLSIYLLSISSFIPIIISKDIIHIFNINNISNHLNENILMIIYGAILMNIMITLISGYLIKYRFNNKKAIKIYSINYALFISSIVHISKIDILGGLSILNISRYNEYVYIGSNMIVAFIIAYIYSYLVSTLGYKMNK